MRTIKFRAWIKRKNELMYLKGFRYSGNEKIKITFTDEDCDDCTYTFLKEDVVLEQFTGLHDKNGVEIYENDIVKCHEAQMQGIILYDDKNGKFVCDDRHDGLQDMDGLWSLLEVIGNIHESENK